MDRPIRSRSSKPDSPPRNLLLLMPNTIECEAFAFWCEHRLGCDLVESATNMATGEEDCRKNQPRLLVVDPSIGRGAVERGVALVREQTAYHLLVLDSRLMEVHLSAILNEPGTSYFSRSAPSQSLVVAMTGMLINGRRAFDPSITPRIRHTELGLRLDNPAGEHSISLLTPREQHVMRLLAEGRSVRLCAEMLGVAESTIDNHKSRLMKKLGIHKSSELAVRAIRDGLM